MIRTVLSSLKKNRIIVMLFFLLPACSQESVNERPLSEKNIYEELKKDSYDSIISIGLVPEVNIFEQKKRYQPMMKYLSRKLDMQVQSIILEHYDSVVEALNDGNIDVAVHGSFNFAFLDKFVGVEPLARPLWNNGVSTYTGYIAVRQDSGLSDDLSKWKGKRLSLVSRSTTAGYLFPLDYLREHGVFELDKFFGNVTFSGSHDASFLAVYEGLADIAAGKNHVFNKLAEKDSEFKSNMLIIAESKEVPSNTFSAAKRLDPKVRLKLKNALVEMNGDLEGRVVLEGFGAQRFISTNRSDFKPLYEMISSLNIELDDPSYKQK